LKISKLHLFFFLSFEKNGNNLSWIVDLLSFQIGSHAWVGWKHIMGAQLGQKSHFLVKFLLFKRHFFFISSRVLINTFENEWEDRKIIIMNFYYKPFKTIFATFKRKKWNFNKFFFSHTYIFLNENSYYHNIWAVLALVHVE